MHARESAELCVEQGFWEGFVADLDLGVSVDAQMRAYVQGSEPWAEDVEDIEEEDVNRWVRSWKQALWDLRFRG